MPGKGTLIKREGTQAFFYSRNKVWRPMEIRGVEPTDMRAGHIYSIDFAEKRILSDEGLNRYHEQNLEDLRAKGLLTDRLDSRAGEPENDPGWAGPPPREDNDPPECLGPGHGQPPAGEPSTAQLMLSATYVVQGVLGTGVAYKEAVEAGLMWGSLWGTLPHRAGALLKRDLSTPAEDNDNDLPF